MVLPVCPPNLCNDQRLKVSNKRRFDMRSRMVWIQLVCNKMVINSNGNQVKRIKSFG